MAKQPWLEQVREQLIRHRLPPAYVRRFLDELSDHFQDLTEEAMSTEASVRSRLGEPNDVAETAVIAYRRRSFLGRHPGAALVVFGLSPIVALAVTFWLACGVIELLFTISEKQFGVPTDQWVRAFGRIDSTGTIVLFAISLLTVVVPALLISLFYGRLATRLCLGRKWIVVACLMLAAVAILPRFSARFSDVPGQSALMFAIPIPQHLGQLGEIPGTVAGYFRDPRQVIQFLVPLAVGGWFLRRKREEQPENRLRLAA